MTIVNLFDFFPFAWIMHFIRILVVFNVAKTLLKDKYNAVVTFFVMFVPSFIFSYFTIERFIKTATDEFLCMIIFYAILLICVFIVCEGKIIAKIATIIFAFFAYLSGTVVFGIINSFFDYEGISGLEYEMPLVMYLASAVITYAFSYVTIIILKLIKNKIDKRTNYSLKNIYMMIFPLTHVFTTIIAMFSLQNYIKVGGEGYITFTEPLIAIFYAVCFVSDFFIFFAIEHNEQTQRQNEAYKRLVLQNQMDYEQIVLLKKEKAEFRKIKHDMSNVLSTAKGLAEMGNTEKAVAILQDITNDITELYGLRVCSNDTINTIISMKKDSAESSDCKLVTNIEEHYAVNIDDYDMCRIMCNLLDNAIRATANNQSDKSIKLDMGISDKLISIRLSNIYNKKAVKSDDNSDIHGNGIKIIKQITQEYKGTYKQTIEDDIYSTEILIPNVAKSN